MRDMENELKELAKAIVAFRRADEELRTQRGSNSTDRDWMKLSVAIDQVAATEKILNGLVERALKETDPDADA